MKAVYAAALLTVSALSNSLLGQQFGDYRYIFNGPGVTITGYNGTGGAVVLPATIGSLPVTAIGYSAFAGARFSSLTIPASVGSIANMAFANSTVTALYFEGDAPTVGNLYPFRSVNATVYYVPRRSGWSATFNGMPTAPWLPKIVAGSIGVRTNRFSFTVAWADGNSLVLQGCTNLAKPTWLPIQTNVPINQSAVFADAKLYLARFYRLVP